MKVQTSIILILLALSLHSQVQKIKIKKVDTLTCNYKFIADSSMIDKVYKIDFYKFTSPDKLKKNTIDNIRLNIRLVREKTLLINKPYFDSLVTNVCIINKFKLNKIEIKKSGDSEHIEINFNYKKIKKKKKN
jgi:hypothetical protein